jgi:predicted tellurium resistance membrane protein TerC
VGYLYLEWLRRPARMWTGFPATDSLLLAFDFGIRHRFAYLKQALAVLLIFIGSMIFVADHFGFEKLPAALPLGVTLAMLAAGACSLWRLRIPFSNSLKGGS